MSDTIIKVANKTENFTIVSNEVPKRNDVSARAKGLYFYLMTLPKNWEIHKCEIYEHFTEGRDALDTAFNELMNAGYIKQEIKKEKGKFVSFTYTIYEESINGKPLTGNPETVLPETENPHLLSTNSLLSTNKQSTDNKEDAPEIPAIPSKPRRVKKEKEEKKPYGTFKNVFLSDTDYSALKEAYTENVVLAGIEAVSKYVQGNSGKHYSNFNKVMLSWGIEAGKEAIQSGKYKPIQKQKEYVKQEKQVCPKCGKSVEFGQCVDCGIFVGLDGKEVVL